MPTYDFRCTACDLEFQRLLPMGDKGLPPCPVCAGASRKVLRPPMTIFKGTGFYKTDSVTPSKTVTERKSDAPKPQETSNPQPAATVTPNPNPNPSPNAH